MTTLFSFGVCAIIACDVLEMSRKKKGEAASIRLRIDTNLLDRIDKIAGERGRQRFIHDAILGRLDEELPPVMFDLIRDVDDLKARVTFLESSQSTSMHLSELNEVARNELCLDEIDRKLIAYFIRHEGATSPKLAEDALGGQINRRTVRDRLVELNKRAKKLFGKPILVFQKGLVKDKRSAWWITNVDLVVL